MKKKIISALFMVVMLDTAGCSSKHVSPDSELRRLPSGPVADAVLLPHEYTKRLNEALQSLPLKKFGSKK